MIYVGTPSGPEVEAAMSSGWIACITTPAQGNVVPDGAVYACDNGRFTDKGWPGLDAWWVWLQAKVARYGAERCLWATAPDVLGDPVATLEESRPWLARIRALGVPAAFVAQDGAEAPGLVPWGEFDWLFLGGSTAWKLGPGARQLVAQAKAAGLRAHMGRVNTRNRLRLAAQWGCDSVDGTTFTRGPAKNLASMSRWLRELDDPHPALFGGSDG